MECSVAVSTMHMVHAGKMCCLQLMAAAVCASDRGSLLQAEDRQMQAISDRLMGDAAEQGDISFGGEVSVEAQVSCWSNQVQRHPSAAYRYYHGSVLASDRSLTVAVILP